MSPLVWRRVADDNPEVVSGEAGDERAPEAGKVAILLGYYDGNQHLRAQVTSILHQTYRHFTLFIADDCSPREIDLERLALDADDASKIRIGIRNSNLGFVRNFLQALATLEKDYDYFAFSDQDDVWYPDKLERALKELQAFSGEEPVLYCARTMITDELCQADLNASPSFTKPPSFANALLQNIATGNSMVFNKAARDLIVQTSRGNDVVAHDWWSYLIIAGAGGHVLFDPEPCLRYRQHPANVIGLQDGWSDRLRRIGSMLAGSRRRHYSINFAALMNNRDRLTPENQRILDDVITARQSGLFKRLYLFKRSGIHSQRLIGTLGLILGIVLNRI